MFSVLANKGENASVEGYLARLCELEQMDKLAFQIRGPDSETALLSKGRPNESGVGDKVQGILSSEGPYLWKIR
jgi:hypothetical protein